jgi:hypothetical protein
LQPIPELRLGMVFEVLDAEVVLVKDEDGDERRVRQQEGRTNRQVQRPTPCGVALVVDFEVPL